MAESRPRVLWVHQNFVSRAQAGNERPLYTVAALLERGFAVDLVTTTDGYLGSKLPDGNEALVQEGALSWHRIAPGEHIDFVSNRARAYAWFARCAARLVATLPTPDLIFSSTPPLPQLAPAIAGAARRRIPLVVEVRDLWPGFLREAGLVRSRPLLLGLEALEALAYRSADALVSVSPAFVPYFESVGVERQRVVVAPHGAPERDVASLRDLGTIWRRERGLENAFVLLYTGSLHPHYGVETLLSVARRFAHARQDVHVVVVGNGRAAPLVRAAAEELGNLTFEGPQARRDLDPLLGAADVGLVTLSGSPLSRSVLPGKLVDYLSSGLPVVCTVSGQAARLVAAAGAGWCCADTPGALWNTLEQVIDAGSAELHARGERGRLFVRGRMSAEVQGRLIAERCERVIASHGPPRVAGVLRSAGGVLRALVDRRHERALDATFRRNDGLVGVQAFEDWMRDTPEVSGHVPLHIPKAFD